MTTHEALMIAAQAKPKHRQPMDKLQGSTAADLSTGVTALRKSYDVIGNDVSDITAQLSKIAADVEYLENFKPGSPVRRLNS
jgi:hypothetical protein